MIPDTGVCGAALPERCHTVLPGLPAGSNIAICVRGEQGVQLTRLNFGDTEAASRVVRAFNTSLGVDAVTERAMLLGCLLGWHAVRTSWEIGVSSIRLH